MKITLATTYILTFFWADISYSQQDPLYNQYQFDKVMVNPAYAGIYNRFTATLIGRRQWAGIEGAPQTNSFTAHSSFLNGKLGAGILVVDDQLGVNKNFETQVYYSYNIKFNNYAKLALGLQTGIINYRYDYNELNLDFVDDPQLNQQEDSFSEPNFGFGAMYMSSTFYLGVSVPRILKVELDDGITESTRYLNHYYLMGGILLSPTNVFKIKLTSLVRYSPEAPLSVDLTGSALLAELLWVGMAVRNLNTIGINTLLELSDQLRFGYSFELATNALNANNFGTHEISIGIDLDLFKGHILTNKYF
ncbi:MAG: type IX secretion system membrane protein PorP/SprF [Bacteroidota bacterium]